MYDTGKEISVSRAAPHSRLRLWGAVTVATLLAAAPTVPVLAQWTTQSPLPTHLEVRGVAAPAPGRVFLATDDDSFDGAVGSCVAHLRRELGGEAPDLAIAFVSAGYGPSSHGLGGTSAGSA